MKPRPLLTAMSSVVTAPPAVGALYVLALAAIAGRRGLDDDADLGDGRRIDAVAAFIEHRFDHEITRVKIGIVAAAIALGIAIGLVGEVLVRLRHPKVRLLERPWWKALVE